MAVVEASWVESGSEEEEEEEEGMGLLVLLLELLARVEDVGIVALEEDCFRAAALRADEDVEEEMIRSMCEAMLSEDSVRKSSWPWPVGRPRGLGSTGG